MANSSEQKIRAKDLRGFKYLKQFLCLLESLHVDATQRDRAGNRQLFFDDFAALHLLRYFSPIVSSLRGLQQASELAKVQKVLGCPRTSLGSLSEASGLFDPELLRQVFREAVPHALPLESFSAAERQALGELTAVDGSLFAALPKMAWALWQDERHRAVKMHVHFQVFKGVPDNVTVTAGNASERTELRHSLQAGRFYVMDRGYHEYQLFQDIIDAQSSFVCRIQDHAAFTVLEERPLSDADRQAGVVRDVVVGRLGTDHHKNVLRQPMRLVFVKAKQTTPDGQPIIMVLASNRLDLAAELLALAFSYRWQIELFFRWFKHILGCRRLLAQSENGVTIEIYLAILASLLISLWLGKKPTLRTVEMLQFLFSGWASEEEFLAHLDSLPDHAPN